MCLEFCINWGKDMLPVDFTVGWIIGRIGPSALLYDDRPAPFVFLLKISKQEALNEDYIYGIYTDRKILQLSVLKCSFSDISETYSVYMKIFSITCLVLNYTVHTPLLGTFISGESFLSSSLEHVIPLNLWVLRWQE